MTDLMWDMANPVGSVRQFYTDFDPNDVRGEWKRIEGRFLLASSSSYAARSTGGQSNHRHYYAVKTTHYYGGVVTSDSDPDDGFALWDFRLSKWVQGNVDRYNVDALTTNTALDGRMAKTGGILANTRAMSSLGINPSSDDENDTNILPPYLAVNTWRRVA